MNDLINFLSKYPILITAPIAVLAAFFGFRSWRINKVRLGIDEAKFYQDFTQAINCLKSIFAMAEKIDVKKNSDLNIENIKSSIEKLSEIIILIDRYEDKFKNAYFAMESIYLTRSRIIEFINELKGIQEIDYNSSMRLSSQFGFIYMSLYFMGPNVIPRVFTSAEIRKKLDSEKFILYYQELVWKKY